MQATIRTINTTNCQACGAAFQRPGRAQKRCDGCRASRRLRSKPCLTCGVEFPARSGSKGYCSKQCANRATSDVLRWLVCECGQAFVGIGKNPGRCWDCRCNFKKQNNCHQNSLRRTRMAQVEYERVNRLAVFERDGWMCKLCGEPTERETTRMPMSATLDHVVPVVHGGGHTMQNLQCAHFKCNGAKGAGTAGGRGEG